MEELVIQRIFRIVLRCQWVVFILATCVNGLVMRRRARNDIAEHPERAEGYNRLIRWYIFWANVPWGIMGIGITVGSVPTVVHYLAPREGNPWVTAFYGSVIAVWGLVCCWVFFLEGAEMLVEHPRFLFPNASSPARVKLYSVLLGVGMLFLIIMLFLADTPVPEWLS